MKQRGFTYIGVLLATAILTAGLGVLIESWHTTLRREREADLFHIGTQYQRAIRMYYEGSPAGQRRYPRELKELVSDERFPTRRRYLRKLYPDPITGGEWAIMKAADGGIMGVYSTSTAKPLKVRGTAASYQDWKFAHAPSATSAAAAAAAPKPRSPLQQAPAR